MHTAPHAGTPGGQGIQPAACALFIAPLLDFVEFRLHKILHQAGKPKLNDVFVQIQYQGDDKFRLLVQYWVNYGGAYGMTQVSAIKTIAAVNEPLGNIHVDMDIWVRSLLGNLIDSVSLLPEK